MALLESGKVLGRWSVVRFIDDGGNGEVWGVVDEDDQPAALKVLRDYRGDSVPYERFCREISAVQALGEHPGVLPILDVHLPDEPRRRDRAWYVMPLARPLAEVLEDGAVTDVVAAIASLAETLAELHERGIAHRDLKPGNLLWHDGGPVLGDFGLVHLPDAEALTESGRVPGSFGYIADELMVEPRSAEASPADVYALAKVLWKLLTPGALYPLQRELRADGGPATLARSLTVPHAEALDRILERATAPVQARLSMAELAADLRGWLALPAPAGFPEGVDVVLEAARRSMDVAVAQRDLAAVRERAVDGLRKSLIQRCADVVQAVRSLDPAGAQVGPLSIGGLHALIEQPVESGPPPGPPFHHGVRVTRSRGYADQDVLVVAFCLQVPEDGSGTITGVLLAGDEHTHDNLFRLTRPRRAEPGVEMEAAIEQTVAEAAEHLPEALTAFTARSAAS